MNLNKLKVNFQYFMPKQLLTRLIGFIASAKLGKFTTFLIKQFIANYRVNTQEMVGTISDYETFNDFFSRPLKNNARPINKDKKSIVFPADGKISQFGTLTEGFILQAKNHYYTAEALLGGDDGKIFKNGKFITVYLSPKDYHRVHIPFAGTLKKMTYIPGELFSVNPLYAENIPELFSRNERVVCIFDTEIGKMAVVLVGATIVRSITTQWAGVVAPNKSREITTFEYNDQNIKFNKGDEIGKFTMGSTVICLFEKNSVDFEKSLETQIPTKVGEKMASTHK